MPCDLADLVCCSRMARLPALPPTRPRSHPPPLQVKGSNVCELCKAEIRNIPAPPPRPTDADLPQLDEAYFAGGCLWSVFVVCVCVCGGLRARGTSGC